MVRKLHLTIEVGFFNKKTNNPVIVNALEEVLRCYGKIFP